ncbi:S-formylglutathione hydrolase [Roseateles asaccharophilus]|uniref:S-formylglutathione hydrolase n=1 Tax=Roseateles asaccharophilus TaxID=582607 RepID=A0ABU2A6D1_9BURK|nr:S-formylglutathione hydrolase [Roseateles asaccharophilus]MDR7332752.1 S-formylglutathione hydrolase [Roseateles asaccharophilus]
MKTLSEHRAFNGVQRFLQHDSAEIGLPMRFALYLPPEPKALLVFLAGLTCTEETFTMKAGAQRLASELGLALLMPDTSPRGANVPGEADAWDFGVGAGFYLDATREPWARHWRMESWLLNELIPQVQRDNGLAKVGLFGHSMGGHGALTLALRHPGRFQSLSAFAPIAAPMQCPWGQKAFSGYLGDDRSAWAAHDATELMRAQAAAPYPQGILIDQGLADKFLAEQLHPEAFEAACDAVAQPLNVRRHAGYDHGYYFIASFIDDHLRHHASGLA